MGKIAATAVVHLINGRPAPEMPPINTCYSWVSDTEAMAVVNAYRIDNGKVVQIEQKLTPGQSPLYAQHATAWATSIWATSLRRGAGPCELRHRDRPDGDAGRGGGRHRGSDRPRRASRRRFRAAPATGAPARPAPTAVPILAGMPGLVSQEKRWTITLRAAGRRPEMEPFSKMVKTRGVDEVAAYSPRSRARPRRSRSTATAIVNGRAAAATCAVCHGEDGRGDQAKGHAGPHRPAARLPAQPDEALQGREAQPRRRDAHVDQGLDEDSTQNLADLAAYYSSLGSKSLVSVSLVWRRLFVLGVVGAFVVGPSSASAARSS